MNDEFLEQIDQIYKTTAGGEDFFAGIAALGRKKFKEEYPDVAIEPQSFDRAYVKALVDVGLIELEIPTKH